MKGIKSSVKLAKDRKLLTIKGLMNDEDIRWKKIPCACAQDLRDVTHRYPIAECLHCKFQEQEDSLPRIPFDVQDLVIELKQGILTPTTKTTSRHITEIKIVRGKKYDEILGWNF
jgi:hypothetical protein